MDFLESLRIFGNDIDYIKKDRIFNEALDNFLSEERFDMSGIDEVTGRAISTCHFDHEVLQLPKFFLIKNWLENVLFRYSSQTNLPSWSDYKFNRAWVNRIFEGCSGEPHIHGGKGTDLVVILYYHVPKEDSSNLVLIDDTEIKKSYNDYDFNKLAIVPTKTGMAICHSPKMLHAVTEHRSKEPRTCFVFDISLKWD